MQRTTACSPLSFHDVCLLIIDADADPQSSAQQSQMASGSAADVEPCGFSDDEVVKQVNLGLNERLNGRGCVAGSSARLSKPEA